MQPTGFSIDIFNSMLNSVVAVCILLKQVEKTRKKTGYESIMQVSFTNEKALITYVVSIFTFHSSNGMENLTLTILCLLTNAR